jgi:3-dehydroquinate dehydratase-2
MKKILFINGPNMNLLGKRALGLYGAESLEEIAQNLKKIAKKNNLFLSDFQHNVEGEIVSFLNKEYLFLKKNLQDKREDFFHLAGIIINPAAYSHTSLAIHDALELFQEDRVPIIEVHLSNIYARESFRRRSFVSSIATGVVSGLGSFGYLAALNKIIELENNA